MPTYEYLCQKCRIFTDITKPIADIDLEEKCPGCENSVLERMISRPNINTSNCSFEPGYNWGLGQKFSSKKEIKEHLARVKGETGREIVEVGNDRMTSVKKQRKEYTLD